MIIYNITSLIFINHQQPSGGNFKQSTSQIKPSINYIYIYQVTKTKALFMGLSVEIKTWVNQVNGLLHS